MKPLFAASTSAKSSAFARAAVMVGGFSQDLSNQTSLLELGSEYQRSILSISFYGSFEQTIASGGFAAGACH